MASLRLYVLRHGEPLGIDTFYGHTDLELSVRGHAQVRDQVAALHEVGLVDIHTSDLVRARVGAQAIAGDHGLPLVCVPALREMHLGDLEGVRHRDARVRFAGLARRSYRDMLDYRMPGGGESVEDVAARAIPYVERIIEPLRRRAQHGERVAAAVYTHNTVVRVLLAHACGLGPAGYGRFEQGLGAINRIDFSGARTSVDVWHGASIAFSNLRPPATLPD